MAHANPYTPGQVETLEQAQNELVKLADVVNQIIANQKMVQRDDGCLMDCAVVPHTLSDEVVRMIGHFELVGAYAARPYQKGQVVTYQNRMYVCVAAHHGGAVMDMAQWRLLGMADFNHLQQLTDNKLLWLKQNAILPYDSDTDYPVGAVTLKGGKFQKWDGAEWADFIKLEDFHLQQLTDNKLLWLKQNAILPYDSDTDYPVGTVTLKDGRFKQWNGTNWINFGQDDSALKSANNLSDLLNKATARNNLDVYSKNEVDNAISSAIPPETPNATETVAGKAKIATTAIAKAGTNDTDIITAKKLRDVENFKSGLAVVLATGVIGESSGCISSCSKSSTGIYNVTLSNPSGLRVFAVATSNATRHPAVVLYDSATSLTVRTQNSYDSTLRDTPFTIIVELR